MIIRIIGRLSDRMHGYEHHEENGERWTMKRVRPCPHLKERVERRGKNTQLMKMAVHSWYKTTPLIQLWPIWRGGYQNYVSNETAIALHDHNTQK